MVTTYFRNKLLEDWFMDKRYDVPNTLYIGLSVTSPNEDGSNVTEPTASSYTRIPMETGEANFNNAVAGTITNKNALRFPASTEAWTVGVDISHMCVFDALTGGNLLLATELPEKLNIPPNITIEIGEGLFSVQIKDERDL